MRMLGGSRNLPVAVLLVLAGMVIFTHSQRPPQNSAPRVVIPPYDYKVPANSRVTVFCSGDGFPTPSITWWKNDRQLSERRNRYITQKDYYSTLMLDSVSNRLNGVYQCVVDNGVGSPAIANATLFVYDEGQALPEGYPVVTDITNKPVVLIERGFPMKLECAISGTPPPQVIWYKNQVPVDLETNANRVKIIKRPNVPGSHDLQISNSQTDDTGDYVCMGRNIHGTVYSNRLKAHVKVRTYPPEYTRRPNLVYNVMAGGSLNITCVAVGSPMPYVQWGVANEPIHEIANSPIGKNVLQLRDIQKSENYSCTAQSQLGMIIAQTEVRVQALPGAPRDVYVDETTAMSTIIHWKQSPPTHGPVSNSVSSYLIQFRTLLGGTESKEWREQGHDDIQTSLSYTLSGLMPYTIYEYRVVPYISHGQGTPSDIKQFRTLEAAPTTAPSNVSAKAVDNTSALIRWRAPAQPNGEIQSYSVVYIVSSEDDQPKERWMLVPGVSNNMYVIEHLISEEQYSVSVQAKNKIGTGPYSTPIKFHVRLGVPNVPRNLQAVSKTSRTISLAWEKPSGSNNVLSYEIYINNSRNRQNEVRSVIPAREQYVLEDLFPNTVYTIKVTARSSSGEGSHTTTILVKTDEAEPSAPPLNIQAEAPKLDASKQLKVVWEPPPAIQANGDITGYKLYYIIDSQTSDDSAEELRIDDPSDTTIVLDNLEVWTKYRIWMRASTSVGDSPPSEPVVARTGEAVPNAPKLFQVTPLNSSAVILRWRKPTERDANGEIRGYQIYQSEMDGNNRKIGDPKVINLIDDMAENYTASGLEARTKYVFQIRAFTVAGNGESTRVKTVVTLGAVPTAPRRLRLEIVEEDPPRVRVTWDDPQEAHGNVRSYRLMWGVRHSSVLGNTVSISSSRRAYTATGLKKGTEFEFRLQAQNEENYGVAAVDHIRTEDGVPSGSPQNITIVYQSNTSALVTWRELESGLRNGVITMYQVRYQDQYNPIDLRAENTSETALILSDLTPNVKYFIQVVAFTSAGAGPTSHRVSYIAKQSRPPAPQRVVGVRLPDATSIRVSWQPPQGSVIGFKIHYSTQDMGTGVSGWKEVMTNQPTSSFILRNLDPVRAYAIKVQAVGSEGDLGWMSGEAIVNEVVPVTTPEENVRSLSSSEQTSTTVRLTWTAPTKEGALNYRIRFSGTSEDTGEVYEGIPVPHSAGSLINQKDIEGLKPNYLYQFEVLVQYEGENDFIGVTTYEVATKAVAVPQLKDTNKATIALSRDDNDFDEVYIIVTLSVETREPSAITLQSLQTSTLLPPSRRRRAVVGEQETSGPYIAGKFNGRSTPNEFDIGDELEYGEYTNRKLQPGVEYKAFVRVVISGDEFSSSYTSPFTSGGPVPSAVISTESEPESNKVALILGPIGSGVVIIVIIVIIVVVIRRSVTHKKEKAPELTPVVMDQPPVYPNDPVELRRMQFSTPGMQNHPPIPVLQLSGHIDQLRAHDNLKFSQEYESIEPGQQFTWDNSNLEYNKPKNRYANVIAYDHSRVVLQPIDGIPGSDYINGNYMDGYRKQNAYISTQGPLPETFGDFWRMVWEQRSATIVMMTKLEERSRVKCDTYWPSEGTEMYGPIIVTLTDCMELATYTVRTFQIERDGWAEKREIRQFQFTAWPDHGVPDYPTPLLIFMRRVKAATPSDSGPMVVHCSAGVGRTGAFIVIDAMLERIKHEKTVDIYGHVTCLRAQRNYMVQTEDQYVFIHDALLEAVLSGNTEIPARNLYAHIQKLTYVDGTSTTTGMEKEFKTLSNAKPDQSVFASANLPVNKFKNRLVNVLPYETTRVCLSPIRGVEGSDYINASFIDGYRFKKAYIATQGPLAETAEDFWRMIWEHNSTIVVMLTKTREMGREKCFQYWPEERSARYQYFVVDPHAEYSMTEYTLREFKVTDARDGQSRTVRLFMFNEWPEQGIPSSGMSFIQFIGQVHKTKEQFGQEGPITVHCSAGVGRTGVFISLSIILERMRYEGVVDMFQTVKMLRTQRQGMVQTEEQYGFCYQAALEHLASFDHY